jgi:hypothetical protein
MDVKELEAKVKTLEKKIQTLEDTEEIKRLQRAYGYYLEHWMAEDVIDLFAEGPDTELKVAAGHYMSKESIRDFFHHGRKGIESKYSENGEFLHQVMQLSGVVNVDPDGRTAKGRWYGFGANAFPQPDGKINPGWMNGVYENEYVKQDGKWKIKKIHWCMTFHCPYTVGWVEPSRRMDVKIDRPYQRNSQLKPEGGPEETLYPSGFICPFHFNNPVSGRHTV